MIVKLFSFSVSLSDPVPRTVRARGKLYAVEDQELVQVQGAVRSFMPSEDALSFDLDFADVLRLSVADIVHAVPLNQFDCEVSVHEVRGTALKVYEVLDDNSPKKLIIVFEERDGEAVKRYARSIASRAEWNSRRAEIAQLLGVCESELGKIVPEW